MSTQTTINQQPAQRASIGSTFGDILQAVSTTASALNNTARILDETTGALADKAANWRESSNAIDAINHNNLMAQYNAQAKVLGLKDF